MIDNYVLFRTFFSQVNNKRFFFSAGDSFLKVFYGQEPPSGESTTTECGVNYQLLAVIYWSSQLGTPGWSRPELATVNGVRHSRYNWLGAPPTLMGSTSWALVHSINRCGFSSTGYRSCNLSMRGTTLPMRPLMVQLGKVVQGKIVH